MDQCIYKHAKEKANIYIVKRRHFKVRSKKGKVRTGLFEFPCKAPAGVQIIHYIYVQLYTHSTRTLTDKTHTDWLHTNA